MFRYLVATPLLLPLAGILLMEKGAYGVSIGQYGYTNGAFLAYLLYTSIFLVFFILFKKKTKATGREKSVSQDTYRRFFYRVSFLHIVFIILMLFFFDAYHIWSGDIEKGEFRVRLGSYGFIAYLITKFISPCVLAYLTYLYICGRRSFSDRVMLIIALLLGLIFGSTWGFKTTGISLLLPSLLILFWSKGFWSFLKIGIATISVILVMGVVFDDQDSLRALVEVILVRLTIIQGDVSWMMWDMYQGGYEFPSYTKTLLSAMGDRLLVFFLGLDRQDYQEWVLYHYDLLINQIVGLSLESVRGGHTIVGTPFSEGLVMFGLSGVVFVAAFGGWLCAFLHNKIQAALVRGSGFAASLLSTYFCLFVFSWMIGGAIVQLFHVSVLVGLLIAYAAVFSMRFITLYRKNTYLMRSIS